MRKYRLVQLLVVAALLAVPVAAISAQSGSMNNGNVWDGASDRPGVTSIVVPEALPETGAASSKPPFYAALPAFLSGQAPDTLPETGSDQASALREAYAQLRHDGSVAPAALPETGASLGLNGRDRQVILDQMAARAARGWSAPASAPRTVSLDGISGRDRQTIIDHLAASGVTVTTAQPAALPETGASGASIGSPSDPPLIGAGARAAESVVQQQASLSDPPLLAMFDR